MSRRAASKNQTLEAIVPFLRNIFQMDAVCKNILTKKALRRLTERLFWGIIWVSKQYQERKTEKMEITKKSIIGDILDYEPETAQFFFAIGMHCLGCPASRGESVEDACAVHGTDADALIAEINKFLASKNA